MGSQCLATFKNKNDFPVSGFYNRVVLNGNDEEITFHVDANKELTISISFGGFDYYYMSIHQEKKDGKNNYFEIRSIADFLLLEQVLEKNYNLELIRGRPNYKDFW